ncbi:MAG: glycosyltransferase family 4 protein [Candidatus Electrothrix aestuarii]|nr:glycosyltransferase family 4 protein [Candidatus Electrothrix aestuarii]
MLEETFYLKSAPLNLYIKSNCKRLIQAPLRYIKGFLFAFSLVDEEFPRMRFRNITRFLGAVLLVDFLEEKNISHVHVHFAFGAAGVAIFLQTISNISYSISIHGSDVLLPQPFTEEKLQYARFIISNCKFHIHNLVRRYPSLEKQKFHLVYLGIDNDSALWSKQTRIPETSPLRILNVARLEEVKGHDILIRACARLKKKGIVFECRIAGEGSKREEITALIDKLGLNDSVILLGACYESDVASLFDWSQIMVLSSLSEGTPMTIIEAMLKARPVVAPRITAIPEMVIEEETGFLFTRENYNELADKLAILATRPELALRMGREGRKRAQQMFNIQQNVRRLVPVFEQVIASDPSH